MNLIRNQIADAFKLRRRLVRRDRFPEHGFVSSSAFGADMSTAWTRSKKRVQKHQFFGHIDSRLHTTHPAPARELRKPLAEILFVDRFRSSLPLAAVAEIVLRARDRPYAKGFHPWRLFRRGTFDHQVFANVQ
jgi:hypothetical protein